MLALLCLLLQGQAWAQQTAVMRDHALDRWSTRHGLPHNSLRALAQTPDGRLWMATWEGLVHYNGLDFQTFDRSTRPALADNALGALHVDRQGQLWMGDSRGNVLRRDRHGRWTTFANRPPSPGVLIQAIQTDERGNAWLLYEGKGIGWLGADGVFQFVPPPDGVSLALSYPRMEIDHQGQLWIGTLDGLVLRGTDGVLRNAPERFGLAPGGAWPYRAPNGSMWVVNGNALYHIVDGTARFHHRFDDLPAITEMLVDRHGRIWVGTESDGVRRLDPDGHYWQLPPHEQPPGRILSLLEDSEGSIWIGANGGLMRARPALFSSLGGRDGLSGDYVRAILEDHRQQLWAGGPKGLDRIGTDGRIVHLPLPRLGKGKGPVSVLSLAQSQEGDLWVGTYADGVLRIRADGQITAYPQVQSLSSGNVRALLPDPQGGMWVGSQGGLLHVSDAGVRRMDLPGMPHELITALAWHGNTLWIGSTEGVRRLAGGRVERIPVLDRGGGRTTFGFAAIGKEMWISTDRGLYRWHEGGRLDHVGVAQGLMVDTIFHLTADQLGSAWLTTNRGVLRVDLADLQAVADGRLPRLDVDRYTEIDGMANSQGNGSSGPSALLRADGSYWSASAGGLNRVDPARLVRQHDQRPVTVRLDSVRVDGNWIARSDQPFTIPAGAALSVWYVGDSFLFTERLEYRTRLLGRETDWQLRGSQRHTLLQGLAGGDYVLQIQVRRPGEEWPAEVTEMAFSVQPLWWQRWQWLALAAALLSALVWWICRRIVRLQQQQHRQLLQQIQDRTQDLQQQAQRLLQANQEKQVLLQRMQEQAETFAKRAHEDALTGLANRRAFEHALGRELARSQRNGHRLCLMVLDIDRFASINERFTQPTGDKVLAQVGQLLLGSCREADVIARVEGETFAILMPDTHMREAETVCTRLRALFAAQTDWAGISGIRISFSAGLVEAGALDVGVPVFYRRAETALRRAKESGRDLTCEG